MPAPRRRLPRPRREAALSREAIAREALALLDEEGLEALSTRRLGARLGIEAMSLYHYFPDKQALLEAVVDRVLAEVEIPPAAVPAREALLLLARRYRAAVARHPRAALLVATLCPPLPNVRRLLDAVCGRLGELGLPPARVAHWFVATGHFLAGVFLADHARTLPRRPRGEQPVVACANLDPLAPYLGPGCADRVFEQGFQALLDAAAAEGRAARGGRRRR